MNKAIVIFLLMATLTNSVLATINNKKNVLFLMADDFNHWLHEIGYYPQSVTPNLDALANKGILFMDAQCSSPVCNPSRNALFSGIRPNNSGIMSNSDGYIRDKKGFENVMTMNQYFMQNGYYVYGAGKLYHTGKMGGKHTDPENWSALYKKGTGSPGGKYYQWKSEHKGYNWSAGEFDLETEANDTKMALEIANLLKEYDQDPQKSNKPFFIGCGFFRPHLPWNCHKDFWNLYSPDTLKLPKGYIENDLDDIKRNINNRSMHELIVKEGKWKEGLRAYLANLSYADYNVGIVLDALNQTQFKDNTIICFMGDHGWHLGEKERWSKHEVFDQANHTTMIIYDPSAKGNGQKCYKVVSMQDIYPTLVELCGLPKRSDVEGRSIAPLLNNPSKKQWEWPILMSYRGTHYLKTNEWKLVDEGENSQLYHIKDDPYEWTNLYDDPKYNKVVEQLKYQMDSILSISDNWRLEK